MDLLAVAGALEGSALGVWMRSSPSAYPVANLAHLFGLVLVVGGIGVVDLRLMGLGRQIPLVPLARFLTPLAILGVVLLLGSGFLLFAADARPLLNSNTFLWKMGLLAVALVNALAFQALWRRRLPTWAQDAPLAARAMAGLSLGLWLSTATLGRMIAYT